MADLPSILGGMAQGFIDLGKGAVDMFGTGGAAIGDLLETIRTGKATNKNQNDFRKWLYETDDIKDAAAKGLGTTLNGVQTALDYIPGLGVVSKNPLFNAGQGALGGLADEFKMYGKDYDLGRAGQRAAVSAGGALAAGGLSNALKNSGNSLLSSATAQGLARGAAGGAIGQGGYTAIEGGNLSDILNSATQGAKTGALIGGATGLMQDLKPAKTYDVALTDDERQARIANAKNMLANEQDPERIAELNNQIRNLGGTIENAPSENMKLYRGISAPDDATLQRYIDEMKDPNIAPTAYSGGSAYGQGYYFTPDEGLARYYANESGLPSTAIMEIEVPRNRFTEINKENGNRPADFDLAAIKRGVPEDIRYETGLKDFNDYLDNNGYWGSKTGGENPTYVIMRNDAVLNAKRIDAPGLETTLADADMAVNNPRLTPQAAYDNSGQEIPQELADYFKDASSLVRDENGNLMRFYHGTPNGDFETPRGGSYFTPDKDYADVYQSPNASSISYGKKATNPATYEAYLDIKKPFELSDPEARRIYIDEYVKGGNATGINPYMDNYDDIKSIDWVEAEGLRDFLQESGYDYDSIIADEGGVPGDNGGVISRGRSYMPFNSDQVFTLKKNLAQPLEQVLSAGENAINNAPERRMLGNIDLSGQGNNSEAFVSKYSDALAKAGADSSPEVMAELLGKRGNKDMLRDAFMTQQDNANGANIYKIYQEYGAGKPTGRQALIDALTGDSSNPPELVTYHGVDTDKLKKAINNFDSDIVNPSLQIVNPDVNPGTRYGDIILLGDKDMYFNKGRYDLLDASGKTNAYTRDVYSPRVPDYVEGKNGERYIAGTRKPYTAQNVSDYMNKQGVKAVESTWATPGSVAATQSNRFVNLADILENADKLGAKDANRKAFDDFGEFLSNKVWDYAEKTGHMSESNPYITVDNLTTEIQDALNGRYMPDDFYGLKTPDGQKLLSDIRQEINKLPTDYFELKMNRPVALKEFSGAILPEGYSDQEVLNALKDAGVNVVGNYDPNDMDATLQQTLKDITKGKNRFTTPYMLGLTGLLGGGALMASQKKDKKEAK